MARLIQGRRHYFMVYKPYGVLSQFTADQPDQGTLSDLYRFPPDVYPVGRLDLDSEGLLLVTNDNQFKTKLLSPSSKVPKRYWAQVEGRVEPAALSLISQGMTLRIKGKAIHLAPAQAICLDEAPSFPPRDPPVRFRRSVPDSWVEIILTEGKNRQVRRMLAATGYPVLRLVRVAIGGLSLGDMVPGEVRKMQDLHVMAALAFDKLPG